MVKIEDVSWSLIYTGNGCDTTYTEIHNVDVDLVEPSFTVDQLLYVLIRVIFY